MEKHVNNSGAFAALLTELSKGFHWLSHRLFTAKLDRYRFHKRSIILNYEYLSSKIGMKFYLKLLKDQY